MTSKKRGFTRGIILFSFLLLASWSFAQETDVSSFSKKYVNWHTENVTCRVMGTNVDKAYKKILEDKTPKKKIIVAVIDGGVDPDHEDLKAFIWTNKNEIPGNGIDDDNNGYIDDIHGWNFLGNQQGENIEHATLEVVRVYNTLHPKYDGKTLLDISDSDKDEFLYYTKAKEDIEATLKLANAQISTIDTLLMTYGKFFDAADKIAGKKVNTLPELKAVKTTNTDEKKILDVVIELTEKGYGRARLALVRDHFAGQLAYNYNLTYDSRADIIGDDENDITFTEYGNNDVKGPDAFHGTFCAGIIGASMDNNIGIDGITNNVEIMCVRAVPDGDEYDKDVALAIRYAVDNGAQVINMSFGKAFSQQKKFVDDAIKYAESKGVLLVHAAGNSSKNLDLKDNFPTDKLNDGSIATNVLTIGASSIKTKKTIPTSFSNYGKVEVDLFAPGQDIVSTTIDDKYKQGDGTSFAAPVVSGVAALVWSYYPELTYLELKNILMQSVTDKSKKEVTVPGGTKDDKVNFGELSVTGGIINAYEALRLAEEFTKSK